MSVRSVNFNNLFAFAVVNARSISAKIESLVDLFTETELSLACISETWLKNGRLLDSNILDLEESHGISFITKNRSGRGGGVAVAYDMGKMALKKVFAKICEPYEIVCCAGNTRGTKRKVVVISYYMPPSLKASETENMIGCIDDLIGRAKSEWPDPIIIVSGDANRRPVDNAFTGYPDVMNQVAGPSRLGQFLLCCATNLGDTIKDRFTSEPLASEQDEPSDHRVLVYKCDLPRRDSFTKKTFTFRPYRRKGELQFGRLLLQTNWEEIETGDPSSAAEKLAEILLRYTDECFPLKTCTVKSNDLPWATRRFKRKVRQRKRKFRRRGRCREWKELKAESNHILHEGKSEFLQKVEMIGKNSKKFFQAVNKLKHREAPAPWSILEMFPGESEKDIAETVASFFNAISQEYEPIGPPSPGNAAMFRNIEPYEISARLKKMKKPKSRLRGDIDPRLNVKYCDVLAFPLAYMYNLISSTGKWPDLWKLENVTVIPKNSCPSSLSELRNLSCTPLYSKLLESFVLEEIKKEVKLSNSQYGGMRGCGVDHFLVETWHQILSSNDDNRAGTNLVSIDFEKAFNRMDHGQCLEDLRAKGASPGPLAMVNAFLYGRRMTVRIGNECSEPRTVPGGSPQGSILANFLFCVTVNSFSREHEMDPLPQRAPALHPIGAEAITSTPRRRAPADVSDDSDPDESFRFFRLRKPYVLETSDEEESFIMPQSQINDVLGPPERWVTEKPTIRCYIDDFNCVEKVQVQGAITHISEQRQKCLVHAAGSESVFLGVCSDAGKKKMKVNAAKTQMVCISSSHDDVKSYMNIDGKRMLSAPTLKILGFTFSNRPTAHAHINLTLTKLRRRLWMLTHLRHAGMHTNSLLNMYFSLIRSVADFAAPAYHSLLTANQSEALERIQKKALRAIFGHQYSYATVLQHQNIPTLEERRKELLTNFAVKCSKNERFSAKWFPLADNTGHLTRKKNKYKEFTSRTERLKKSPVCAMRKILNEIEASTD